MKRLLAILLIAASASHAQVQPEPSAGDARLQTVRYDAEQVVRLEVPPGYQLMVRFADGERIETIALGDGSTWQATATKRGDALFLKNAGSGADTNMTVITDARVYLFDVSAAAGMSAAYSVRFIYTEAASDAPSAAVASYTYRISGARAIRPSSITQSGNRLALAWPEKATLPAIFKVDDDGIETLANGEMVDGLYLVEGIPARLVFRLDRLTATAVRRATRAKR